VYVRLEQNEGRSPVPLRIPVPFLQQQTGLGDFLKAATSAVGIKPCAPCQKRAEALNRRIVLRPW
jgi:hypothetical protein